MKARLVLLSLLLALACTDATAPAVRCDGLLEVTTRTTRLGADTVVACTFPPPDTVVTPPDTVVITVPDTTHRHRHRHHHGGHDDE